MKDNSIQWTEQKWHDLDFDAGSVSWGFGFLVSVI